MQDKIFLDSNILIYCFSTTDFSKQKIARELSGNSLAYISTQVLNEIANVLHKKHNISWTDLYKLILDFEMNFNVQTIFPTDIANACKIADKYKFSFYDSLIISTALVCKCNILYSEDLQHNQIIENRIKIINPFQ